MPKKKMTITVLPPCNAKGQLRRKKTRAKRSPVYVGNDARTLEAATWLR